MAVIIVSLLTGWSIFMIYDYLDHYMQYRNKIILAILIIILFAKESVYLLLH